MPASLSENPQINLWDERFNPDEIIKSFKSYDNKEVINYIEELTKLVHKDKTFNNNLSQLVTKLYLDKRINYKFIKKNFLKKEYRTASFYFSKTRRELTSQIELDPNKVNFIKKFVRSQKNISDFYKSEYTKTLIQSNRSIDDIQLAIKSGMTLRPNAKDLEQFKRYIEYLDNSKPHQISSAMRKIEYIYNYTYRPKLPYNPMRPMHERFLNQNLKIKKFVTKRTREIERGLKLQQKTGLIDEIDEAAQREANGIKVHVKEKLRFSKKIDDMELPHSLRARASQQAKFESNIFRRMLNGCNSGNSQRIAGAAKKFSRFKFSLALGATPFFYIQKNYDKMDTDPFFWEKLGHELFMGVVFTWVGNKIFTNNATTFWKKYFEGHLKFSPLSYAEAWSYEELFGERSSIRYFQKLYKGDVSDSKLEKIFNELKASPTFEKDVEELLSYLEEKSKKRNTMNMLDKHFNLSTYSSIDDDTKITQEDLESEEAREMLMELIAERIYIQNMGKSALFQTGGKDTDRFAFYKARSILWDIKGLAVNLAIFEMMCREPFGKVGSWAAILALVIGDQYITGDLTYQWRRDAINQ